jgi:hypothetical protein
MVENEYCSIKRNSFLYKDVRGSMVFEGELFVQRLDVMVMFFFSCRKLCCCIYAGCVFVVLEDR